MSASERTTFRDFVTSDVGTFAAYCSLLVVGVALLVRRVLRERFDARYCETPARRRERRRTAEADEEAARRLARRRLGEEEIKAERESRREEARVKLRKATMTVKEEDLEYDRDPEEGTEERQFQDEDEPALRLRSVARPDGASFRRVPARCVVRLAVYEPGDTVVRSPNRSCRHAFHDDCILAWLSRGRRRCPCCRKKFAEPTEAAEGPAKGAAGGRGEENAEEPAAAAAAEEAPAPGSPPGRPPPPLGGAPSPEGRRAVPGAPGSFIDEDVADDDPPSDAEDDEVDGAAEEDLEPGERAATQVTGEGVEQMPAESLASTLASSSSDSSSQNGDAEGRHGRT